MSRIATVTMKPAAAARSILACPAAAELVVDGVDEPLAGAGELGLRDEAGVPHCLAPPGTPLVDAGRRGSAALLNLDSGVGDPDSPLRRLSLTVTGASPRAGRRAASAALTAG